MHANLSIARQSVRAVAELSRGAGSTKEWQPRQMFEGARLEAREIGTEFYGSEHLLLWR